MRACILLVLVVAAAADAAADIGAVELTDGRVLLGWYDAQAGRLRIAGDVPVEIALAPEQIARQRAPTAAELAELAGPSPQERDARTRNAIITSRHAYERRRGELEEFIAAGERRIAELDRTIAGFAAPRARIRAAVDEIDQADARDRAMQDDLEQQRALTEREITAVAVEVGSDGDRHSQTAVLSESLYRVDQRLRELDQRIAQRDAVRAQWLARLAESQRAEQQDRDDQERERARIAAARAELAEDTAALAALAQRAEDVAPGATATSGGEPTAPAGADQRAADAVRAADEDAATAPASR